MYSMTPPDVIVLTPPKNGAFADTLRWLRSRGFRLQPADSQALESVLRQHRKAPLLIYSPPNGAPAADVVLRAASAIHGRPVLVAVDSSDFGSYYDLMALGVNGYYEVSEGPESIGRALQHFSASA